MQWSKYLFTSAVDLERFCVPSVASAWVRPPELVAFRNVNIRASTDWIRREVFGDNIAALSRSAKLDKSMMKNGTSCWFCLGTLN